MNLSISPLPSFHPTSSRQRRRSNSSSNILASTVNVKAVRSPRRNENLDNTSDNSTEEYFEDNKLASSNRTIPRPPRLAFDTQHNLRIPMTPPSKQEYKAHQQNHQHMLLSYNNINNSHHDYYHHNFSNSLSGKESRTTSFSSTKSNKSTQSMNKSLTAFYNERIEKRTSMAFDDEDEDDDDDISSDSDSDTTLSVSSSVCGDDVRESRKVNRNNQLAKQVSLLRKEIDVVKSSLEGLQKDHKEMLIEKKQLEQQYQEAKFEVTKTLESSTNDLMEYNELLNAKMEKLSLELTSSDNSDFSPFSDDTSIINNNGDWPIEYTNIMNNCVQQAKELEYLQFEMEKSKQDFRSLLIFKEEIENTLEEKEREYLEKLRECEAVANYQVGTIDSMEKLLKELEIKMDKLQSEQRQERLGRHKHSSSQLSLSSILSNNEKFKKKHVQKPSVASIDIKNAFLQSNSSNDNSTASEEDLIPSYCLAPPQSRRQSCTNPITLFTDEERIRHQKRFCLAKRWVEDDEVSICQQAGCSVKFNLWNRRHHCRRCGNIFCGTHSAFSMLLFPDGSEDWGGVWSRVCESCFKDSK